MSGHFFSDRHPKHLANIFGLEEVPPELLARPNMAQTREVLAVVRREQKNRLAVMRWGLIPHWAKDPAIGGCLINARAETLSQRAAFQQPFRCRRCLIVADGFTVWRREDGHKTPIQIRLKSQLLFGLAGLYDIWQSPDGEEITSCAIITTVANALVRPMQERMPAIVPSNHYDRWLDPAQQNTEELSALLKPYPADKMEAHEVVSKLNAPQLAML